MAIANLRPQLLEVETTLQHCADQLVGHLCDAWPASRQLTWPCSSWNGHSPK
jgi:hypothetical protein